MKGYDFNEFLAITRSGMPPNKVELAEAVEKVGDMINTLIVIGIRNPELLPLAEENIGAASIYLWERAKRLQA